MQNINEYEVAYYESIEFDLSDGQTDYDLDANQSAFLSIFGATSNFGLPNRMDFRTNYPVSVKINTTSNHTITITENDSPFLWYGEIRNIFITNGSGSTAAIKIIFRR